MKKKATNILNTFNKLKYLVLSIIIFTAISCTADETGCETETVCFGEGNCVEKPIEGTCF